MSLCSLFFFTSFLVLLASPSPRAMMQENDPSLAKREKTKLAPSFSSDERELPLEIKQHILSFLSKQADLLRASAVSKSWRAAAEQTWTTRTLMLLGRVKEQDYTTLARGIFPRVNLRHKKLKPMDVDVLLRALTENATTLISLNLANNQIGDEGAIALAHNTILQRLNLDSTQIGDGGARALAQNMTLTSLSLGSNKVGDEGAIALAHNTTLTSLDLSWNQVGDEGAIALAQNATLTALNLYWNKVGDEGAKALAQNATLTWLGLSWNRMGDKGAKALEDLKRRNPSLKIYY